MDLFVVNRYEGNTEDKPKAHDSSADHLQRLLLKIEQKKKEAVKIKSAAEKLIKKKQKKGANQAATQTGQKQNSNNENAPNKKKLHHQEVEPEKSLTNNEAAEISFKNKERKQKRNRSLSETLGENNDLDGKFTVIGSSNLANRKEKVKAVLPHWLANPSVVSVDLKNLSVKIDDIPHLDRTLVQKLRKNGIEYFFPVQHQVIPWLLEAQRKPAKFWPRDVCVSAPTGSGKTLAFVLPIIQALQNRVVPRIRALVVLPVQELAAQVYKVYVSYLGHTSLQAALITGNESFQREQAHLVRYSEAHAEYYSLVDIVVTTPGRLVDHLQSTQGFSLHYLKYLVIDEADRVMASMQNDWLYHLERHITSDCKRGGVPPLTINEIQNRRPPPQKLLFSATLSQDPEKLQQLGLFQPRLFTSVVGNSSLLEEENSSSMFVGKYTTPAELDEQWIETEPTEKPLLLYHLVKSHAGRRVLVFTNAVESVHRLAVLLQAMLKETHKVGEISSNASLKQRKNTFADFAAEKIDILVSSDALARGIDLPNVDLVVSYDTPQFIKNYIHRIGRTGRAGRPGTAVTLVESKQKSKFEQMLSQAVKQDIVKQITVELSDLENYEDLYKDALSTMRNKLENEDSGKKVIRKKIKKKGKLHNKDQRQKINGVTKKSQSVKKSIELKRKVRKLKTLK